MAAFLTVLALLIIAAILAIGLATWASKKSFTIRNIVAFALAAGSSYATGFVLNTWLLTLTGGILPGNVLWPSFTWLAIAFACVVAGFHTAGSPYVVAIPFLLNATLALLVALSSREVVFIAMPLLLGAVGTFLYQRHRLVSTTQVTGIRQGPARIPTHESFAVGMYRLDIPIRDHEGLVEFSPQEYETMGRQFDGEKNYNAPDVLFLGRSWNLMLQTVNGKISKIAPYLVLTSKPEANSVALETLQHCTEQLGKPVEQKSGFYIWDTTDGNVVLQTGETEKGPTIGLFVTSRSIRTFKRL
jgi:hypothetical protein